MVGEERAEIELTLRIEAAVRLGDLAPQQPVGPYDARLAGARRRRRVDDDEVVADRIERADVAPRCRSLGGGQRIAILVEDVVAQLLRLAQVAGAGGEPDDERTRLLEDRRGRGGFGLVGLPRDIGLGADWAKVCADVADDDGHETRRSGSRGALAIGSHNKVLMTRLRVHVTRTQSSCDIHDKLDGDCAIRFRDGRRWRRSDFL